MAAVHQGAARQQAEAKLRPPAGSPSQGSSQATEMRIAAKVLFACMLCMSQTFLSYEVS
jgi:hypothetical protein